MKNKELWKPIEGYEKLYKISNKGEVINLKTKNILKLTLFRQEFYAVGLRRDQKSQLYMVHRLMSENFKIDGTGQHILHKDRNKLNNDVNNLRRATYRKEIPHPIICLQTKEIFKDKKELMDYVKSVHRERHIYDDIIRCCNKRNNSCLSKNWEWVIEKEKNGSKN